MVTSEGQSGSEHSLEWRNAIGALLLFVLLLSIALGVKLSSIWPVAISVPHCAVCQYLVARRTPVPVVRGKNAEQKVVAYVSLGLLLLLLLGVVLAR
jgi:hypothetical protein